MSVGESANELLAREAVSSVLGVPVDRFEDGSVNAQVDAIVRYSDRSAALEIVADHDADFNEQWAALERVGHRVDVPGLRQSWIVRIQRKVRVNRMQLELPALLLALQDDRRSSRPRWDHPSDFARLGILAAWPMETGRTPGRAFLFAEANWGFAGDEHTLGRWVTRVLTSQADVSAKLAAHSGAAEKHAFIWATVGTDMGVQIQLESSDGNPFPSSAPSLPDGVSHVWVADWPRRKGGVAWFPDRGWWRIPWP